ncbi:ead/Ea22-like family protein [Enterobacter asburiae]|uniref:ead/Ea22-like family protein n=1 Tax=Enterobacter asburiae TaxID=61645 RepID=UPI001F34F473|nr:ead/Ea22-like family protein [Enterobacter asburiae]
MNIDKQALREAAEKAISEEGETWWNEEQLASDYGLALHRADAKFIAAANPATVLALLDELEAKDNRINRLEAIVAVAEQRNALMREWKRALKVPCDLVDDQVPIVIHGMVIRLERQSGIIQSARKFISEYAGLGDVGADEFIKIIDRAAAGNGEAS